MRMPEIKLKPCPFCGGIGKLETAGINNNYSFVKCKECGAGSRAFRISNEYCSDEKAAEAWNRRTDNG